MTFLSDLSHLFDLCRQRMVNFSDEDAIYETVEFYELFSSIFSKLWIASNLSMFFKKFH